MLSIGQHMLNAGRRCSHLFRPRLKGIAAYLLVLSPSSFALTPASHQNIQDELVALTLQLNVAEQRTATAEARSTKAEADNAELVARWMALKKDEADAMNQAVEPSEPADA